ncbi:PRC-barrel domain-containing protein [Desulfitibacter alkalitolerans]|uniref:PRC-barrel domain-containing protein n=1 Tax=Desulfitibacter alkalitolerans TaxID=264641 RepID=UPI000484849A|nr:PRC-barrel domain-containing protein [Desulfitibacter alkalitolerans]
MNFRGKNIHGKIIISLQNGQHIGKLKGLVIDPENITVAALLIESKALFKDKMIIPYDKVHSVDEIITVKNSSCLEKASKSTLTGRLVKQNFNLFGARIITEDGSILGTVEDFTLDVKTGKVMSLLVTGKVFEKYFKGTAELPVSQIITIGRDAIIAKAGSKEALLISDDALAEKIETIKDSSAKLWSTTKDSTIKWSKQLSATLKNLTSSKEDTQQNHQEASLEETDPQEPKEKQIIETITNPEPEEKQDKKL